MIARLGVGWQTTMADLALILFIVAAAGVHAGNQREARERALPHSDAPLAVYRSAEGEASLRTWIEQQAPDARQQLTITVHYPAGQAAEAARRALALSQEAGSAGASARIVLEQGPRAEEQVVLAYDRSAEAMARSLRDNAQD